MSKTELAYIRNRKIGFIFQAYNLLPRTTAIKNVIMPLQYNRQIKMSPEESEERAMKMLDLVGLTDRIRHQPHELSGGQQQRVAIARALVNHPAIIIADEPTGNLDSRSGAEVLEILDQLHLNGATIVIVTHDIRVAEHTQHIVHLQDGKIHRIQMNGKHKEGKVIYAAV